MGSSNNFSRASNIRRDIAGAWCYVILAAARGGHELLSSVFRFCGTKLLNSTGYLFSELKHEMGHLVFSRWPWQSLDRISIYGESWLRRSVLCLFCVYTACVDGAINPVSYERPAENKREVNTFHGLRWRHYRQLILGTCIAMVKPGQSVPSVHPCLGMPRRVIPCTEPRKRVLPGCSCHGSSRHDR